MWVMNVGSWKASIHPPSTVVLHHAQNLNRLFLHSDKSAMTALAASLFSLHRDNKLGVD